MQSQNFIQSNSNLYNEIYNKVENHTRILCSEVGNEIFDTIKTDNHFRFDDKNKVYVAKVIENIEQALHDTGIWDNIKYTSLIESSKNAMKHHIYRLLTRAKCKSYREKFLNVITNSLINEYQFLTETITRIENDTDELNSKFGVCGLKNITVHGEEESHNGRNVCFLHYDDDKTVVYKPRSVELEHIFLNDKDSIF